MVLDLWHDSFAGPRHCMRPGGSPPRLRPAYRATFAGRCRQEFSGTCALLVHLGVSTMNNIRKGLFAGLIAGLVLAMLYAVDYGPGAQLHTVAKWFALDSKNAGEYIGFVLLLILGALFGLAFGAWQRGKVITLTRAIASGLILGVA